MYLFTAPDMIMSVITIIIIQYLLTHMTSCSGGGSAEEKSGTRHFYLFAKRCSTVFKFSLWRLGSYRRDNGSKVGKKREE